MTDERLDDWLAAPVLEGAGVRLEPLTVDHAEAWAAQHDDALFAYMSRLRPRSADVAGYRALIEEHLAQPARVSWAVVVDGAFAGRISAIHVDAGQRHLECGTILTAARLGGSANPGAKRLLLGRYFDDLGALRCGFKVDSRNARSQAAMTKLGAVREGVQRKSTVSPDGTVRDDVLFSITDDDWPTVRAGLDRRLTWAT